MILTLLLGVVAAFCFWLMLVALAQLDGNMTMRRCFGPECYDVYPLWRLIWLALGLGVTGVAAIALAWVL